MLTYILLGVTVASLALCLAALYSAFRDAPEGYEDSTGFHFVRPRGEAPGVSEALHEKHLADTAEERNRRAA